MCLAACPKGWAGGGHWQLSSPAQQCWCCWNLSLLGRALWLSTIVVVVLSTEALLGQGVCETGSAAGRNAVNEPMEESFNS